MAGSWTWAASSEFGEETNATEVNFGGMCFKAPHGMGVSNGDEIERRKSYGCESSGNCSRLTSKMKGLI